MVRPAADDNNPEGEQLRKLFIGGLDYRTSDETLKKFYEQWGEIVDVVVMKHPTTQKSRGFGFVTYSSSSMVDDAMKNRPHKIDGREVDSKRAVPRDESGVATGSNVNVKKMFVGGLKEQSEEELRECFSEYGNIVAINVVMDSKTGKRKGYAFIEYDDYDPVDKALLRKHHAVAGKSVTVKKAVVKDAVEKPGRGGGGGGGGGGGRSGGGGGRSSGRGGSGPWGGSSGGGGGWGGSGGGAPNGYGSGAGPWDTDPGNGWGHGGGSGGGGWNDQYSSAWNGVGGGYQQNYSGGPVRSNYSTGSRNAPYGGGSSYGGSSAWGNSRY